MTNQESKYNAAQKARIDAEALLADPEYMTPGARQAFRSYRKTSIIAFLILAIGGAFGTWAVTQRIDDHLRHDLNALGVQSCLASIKTVTRYNDFVETQIQANREARELNLTMGERRRADLNTRNIIRLQRDKLPLPTVDQCEHSVIIPE
jgi:hypothetical protein